jgi:hypothetical protein
MDDRLAPPALGATEANRRRLVYHDSPMDDRLAPPALGATEANRRRLARVARKLAPVHRRS